MEYTKWCHNDCNAQVEGRAVRREDASDLRGPGLRQPGVITLSEQPEAGFTVEPTVLALRRARCLWRVPNLERIQGVLDGATRGPVGAPPGPVGLAALRAGPASSTGSACAFAMGQHEPDHGGCWRHSAGASYIFDMENRW